MTSPTFIIIGAHKAGTTSLYEYLSQHPQVYLPPIKETNYFAYEDAYASDGSYYPVRTWEDYTALYKGAGSYRARGDVSPEYLLNHSSAWRIREALPDCKIIVSLREPISRAYSHYTDEFRTGARTGRHPPLAEDVNLSERWVRAGLYYSHLKHYYDLFPKTNILPVEFDMIIKDPQKTASRIFEFIGVDPQLSVRSDTVYNAGGLPRQAFLFNVLRKTRLGALMKHYAPPRVRTAFSTAKARLLKHITRAAPELPEETAQELASLYFREILLLQGLVGIDLHYWLDRNPAYPTSP